MRKLLVLANEFPYGTWEPYMETEEPFYSCFNRVWIASLQLRKEHATTKRELKSNARIIPVAYMTRAFYLINSISVLGDIELYKEILELIRERRFSVGRIIDLFVFLSRAHHEARVINRKLRHEDKEGIIIYSYRFEYQPYVAILLKKRWKTSGLIISRTHGYDIYEDRHKNNYIPLRKIILNNIDYVFPCSQFGVEYLQNKYGKVKALIACRYLGTIDSGERKAPTSMTPLKIVSCSTVVKVKRIEKIIKALSLIDTVEIEWTHYGDGPLLDALKQLASEELDNNIRVYFMGNVANLDLLKDYKSKEYHAFINVSSSEGLPVSIMEAMSFGIPCIATNVGGTRELVNSTNGFLLDEHVEDEEIAAVICKIANMSKDDYTIMRHNARTSWCEKYNSYKNYSEFMTEIKQLSSSRVI